MLIISLGVKRCFKQLWLKEMECQGDGLYRLPADYDARISWGWPVFGEYDDRVHALEDRLSPNLWVETGYFSKAEWFDKRGVYSDSSLNNDPGLYDRVMAYGPPVDLIDAVLNSDVSAKYESRDVNFKNKWHGIVVAGQISIDKQVLHAGPADRYWQWMERIASVGKHEVFIKLHPLARRHPDDIKRATEIAEKHGCFVGYSGREIIDDASSVMSYCSSFVVDCWMRGYPMEKTHVECGTFKAVSDLGHDLFLEGKDPQIFARKFINFLMWKYCFNTNSIDEQSLHRLIKLYVESDDPYPLPEKYSWGQWFFDRKDKVIIEPDDRIVWTVGLKRQIKTLLNEGYKYKGVLK